MSQNKLSDVSTEQLLKRRNLFKGAIIGFAIIEVLVLAAAVFFYTKKESIALFIPLLALPMTLLPVLIQIKALDAEIKSRG